MEAGKLRHRVEIQRRVVSYDSLGHETNSFVTRRKVSAQVKYLSGRELERAKQVVAEATIQVLMRYNDVTPEDQIVWKSHRFNVAAAIPNEIATEVVCLCSEVVS